MWAVGLFYGINSVLNTVDFGFSVTHKGSQENTYIYVISVQNSDYSHNAVPHFLSQIYCFFRATDLK